MMLLLLLSLLSHTAGASSFLVRPYLQSLGPNAVWILWETDTGTESRVEWGSAPSMGSEVEGNAVAGEGSQVHEVRIAGLDPSTRYWYRAVTDDASSEPHSFVTAPSTVAEAPLRIAVISDTQFDGGNPTKLDEIVHQGIMDFVAADGGSPDIDQELDLVMIAGDLVNDGLDERQWRDEFFAPLADLAAQVPLWPTIGNHENNSPQYFRYFHLPENAEGLFLEHSWYADISNVRLVGLDSCFIYPTDEQLGWFQGVLAEACDTEHLDFVFVELHHPFHTEMWPDGELSWTGEVIAALDAAYQDCGKPSIVFMGHTHAYGRATSQEAAVMQVIAATGSGNIDYWGEYANQVDYPEFVNGQDEWGFTVIDVEAGDDPYFRMRRISRGNELVPLANEVRDEAVVRRYDAGPVTPEAISPQGIVAPECVVLEASAFCDPLEDTLQATWWQVDVDCGFEAPIWDAWRQSQNLYMGVDLAAGNAPGNEVVPHLSAESEYCWRVRHRNASLTWSEWSESLTFATTASTLGANLLVNPGAEEGVAGWTVTAGNLESLQAGECDGTDPASGERYFAVGGLCEEAEQGEAYQQVDVSDGAKAIDAGQGQIRFGGSFRSFQGTDVPGLELAFLDGGDVELGASDRLSSTSDTWIVLRGDALLPAGTRSIRVTITGTRITGTDNDSYLDDLFVNLALDGQLTACLVEPAWAEPEVICVDPADSGALDPGQVKEGRCGSCGSNPSSSMMLISAGLFLGTRRRRNR